MPHADSGLDLVDVLAAVATGTERVPFQVRRVYLDVDRVIDQRIDENGRECGLALALGVERRKAHESVHTILSLEIAVGIVALDLDRGRLYSRLVSFKKVSDSHFVTVPLAPAHIHPHQHRTPVVRLGAARSGIYRQHGSKVVPFRAQHIPKLQRLDILNRL